MLNAAIIGFGGIAQLHKNAYHQLEKDGLVRLVAACDVRKEAFTEHTKTNLGSVEHHTDESIRFYTDLEEMLAKETLDYVDICVPTYLHKDLAVKMLGLGYNVLSEKPMALTSQDCRELLMAEKASGKHYMIGQVLRFFPQYRYLKKCIDDQPYGKVLAAFFSRNSAQPTWGFEHWYLDYNRCGGAILDIHIHDVDMVRYLFGEPQAVSCRAANAKTKYDICQTSFYYPNGIPVMAKGCWTPGKIPFSAYYKVDFERATLIYESGKVTVYPEDGDPFVVETDGYDGFTGEIAYFAKVVAGKIQNGRNPASSAAKTVALIEKMMESADQNGAIVEL